MQIIDLIRCSHEIRKLHSDAMAKLPWSEVVADKGPSFNSMHDIFLHLKLVEER